jgi:hypothetical protein
MSSQAEQLKKLMEFFKFEGNIMAAQPLSAVERLVVSPSSMAPLPAGATKVKSIENDWKEF